MTTLRTATQDDLRIVLDWAVAEGWNAGLDDAAAFYAADPEGFFVAEQGGALVAAISVVNHSDSFAFLGLYIVRPEFRGQGIGYALWTYALAHAGDRVVGLDGVPAQQAAYERSGFGLVSSTMRFTGAVDPVVPSGLREAAQADVPGLIAIEAAQSGVAKPCYLSAWFQNVPTRKTYVLADTGFCTVRKCHEGAKIGPLWATDAGVAQALIRHAAGVFDGPVSIDVSAASKGLTAVCGDLGLTPGFETARMYRGAFGAPQTEYFAVTTLELG